MLSSTFCFAQYYGTQSTYSDPYGNSTGSSTTTTDYYGNSNTTYYDEYGNVTGTKSTPPQN